VIKIPNNESQVAIIKRRIVSAQIRQKMLLEDEFSPATPLSDDDKKLLTDSNVVALINPSELVTLTKVIISHSQLKHKNVLNVHEFYVLRR
jgi:hypothetical protein